jgi:hypothetical protein
VARSLQVLTLDGRLTQLNTRGSCIPQLAPLASGVYVWRAGRGSAVLQAAVPAR